MGATALRPAVNHPRDKFVEAATNIASLTGRRFLGLYLFYQ